MRVGPWFSNTWSGRRQSRINLLLVIVILLFVAWKSFF
jgi:hypothetical protein